MIGIAYFPVVGRPPIRSFSINLAVNSLSKPVPESSNENEDEWGPKYLRTQWFVKIDMEGIPIGRKVSFSVYDSYEEPSLAIYDLFSGLTADNSPSRDRHHHLHDLGNFLLKGKKPESGADNESKTEVLESL
ncbi:hypothetical protein F3Y22_tig00111402pilonHSYRG00141 [Hibiscus syriacus]|uniref:Auxin-responsive protein n=1 Tax=Hibiscus syriacus TaxID=106335 RepID=A0A6A2XSU5_HIBSY|nr:hypothetical protein F3Y22_tig00111402pilonHSYRG00141 [Hibiscus syriacus]